MKNTLFLTILLILAASVLLYGCGNDNNEDTSAKETAAQSVSMAETETDAPHVTSEDGASMSYDESANEDEANFNDLFGE